MIYQISADELQVLIELLRTHRRTLTPDQLSRLSVDPDDLVSDLFGKRTGPAIMVLAEDALHCHTGDVENVLREYEETHPGYLG